MSPSDMPPPDLEQIRARHRAAHDALGKLTLGYDDSTPTKVAVQNALRDELVLVASIERVRMTHNELRWHGMSVCAECVLVEGTPAPYPCATIKAIDP